MKSPLLVAALLALALSACGKKEEAATSAAPAAQPTQVATVPAPQASNADNPGTGIKLDNVQAPAAAPQPQQNN